jgi:hypothetical protein
MARANAAPKPLGQPFSLTPAFAFRRLSEALGGVQGRGEPVKNLRHIAQKALRASQGV